MRNLDQPSAPFVPMDQVRVAEIRTDPDGGYEVFDSRTGEALAWRGQCETAGELVDHLNGTYSTQPWPARDTLVHEIVGLRISGVAG